MPEANLFLMFTQRLNTLGVAYMVSGSVAVIIYGEPRLTHDVDLIVVLDREHIARLPEVFPPSVLLSANRGDRRGSGPRTTRTLQHYSPRDRFQSGRVSERARSLARLGARKLEVEGQVLFVAPPEYVIARKLEYYREGGSEKHLRDIRSMLDISPEAIQSADLEQQIAARGLQEAWRQVQERKD
jgi:hypothetical protein